MRYFSLFSGIGGFELGLHSSIPNAVCVGYSEVNKYAEAIYRRHFPEHHNYGDATGIVSSEPPDFDLLVAGFPCQSFSVAGKRRGFQDSRGTLFFEIARLCADKRPRYILLENVAGLLSHDGGKTFQRILGVLADIGYLLQWEVLNSRNYGVPQNRRRVFIVGHIGGEPRPEVFPIGGGQEALDRESQVVYPVDANYYKGAAKSSRSMILQIHGNDLRQYSEECPTLQGTFQNTGGANQLHVKPALNYVGAVVSDKSRKRIDDGKQHSRNFREGQRVYSAQGLAGALTVNKGYYGQATGLYQIDDTDIRRLTPMECERLQAFPDNWTEHGAFPEGDTLSVVSMSDTQRYKCLGNAVTVNVVRHIAALLQTEGYSP